MSNIFQHAALGDVDGEIYLFFDLMGNRNLLNNEKRGTEHAFIKFANAHNLPELMTALDEIYDKYGHAEFIRDLCGPHRPNSVSPDRAKEVALYFEKNPTRTTIKKTQEALATWNFDKMQPSEDAQMNAALNNGHILYFCMPFKDLIEAKEDLRRSSMLMAWLIGKCDFEMAHGLKAGDRETRFKSINDEGNTYLGDYYKRLRENTSNGFVDLNLNADISQLHLYNPKSIEGTVKCYVEAAFSLLLSDETKKMSPYLKPYSSNNTILSAIWSYFATGLDKDMGSNAISVCKHCGRFFQQERATKKFCSNSCRVSFSKNRSDFSEAKRPETQTFCLRQKMKENE